MDRRSFLLNSTSGLILSAASGLGLASTAFAQDTKPEGEVDEVRRGEPVPFSFDRLSARMKALAAESYTEPDPKLPEAIANLNYDQHRAIRFRPDHAVWRGEAPFELQAFHMGWLYKLPVRLHVVIDGVEKPLIFTGEDFEYRQPLDPAKFDNITMPGVAGFRVHYPLNRPDVMDELIAFLGASYFRALGRGSVYGISARGIAINTATGAAEEFPRFTDFYVVQPGEHAKELTIYAALEGESLTGAYEFRIAPGETTTIDVTARLYMRKAVERLGIAPMTSMFLFAENNHSAFDDYRGQVHDSDGLKVVRKTGEELWRSLNNPSELASSFFIEENPKAFGLFQRDRDFDHYQDPGAAYERRPSLLIEPLSNWGRGAVTLIEIPTELEINDNIVAFWVPDIEVAAGQSLEFAYRLTWGSIQEPTNTLARVTALRTGNGGVSGTKREENSALRKFVIDFEGDVLRNLSEDSGVQATVNASHGKIIHSTLSRIEANGAWRVVIDYEPDDDRPVEFTALLTRDGKQISETWHYQWRKGDERSS